jgi:hypothetical protein
MRTKKQYFKVVCSLLNFLSISNFKYVCFNYLRNVINFIRLVNNKANITTLIIKSRLI